MKAQISFGVLFALLALGCGGDRAVDPTSTDPTVAKQHYETTIRECRQQAQTCAQACNDLQCLQGCGETLMMCIQGAQPPQVPGLDAAITCLEDVGTCAQGCASAPQAQVLSCVIGCANSLLQCLPIPGGLPPFPLPGAGGAGGGFPFPGGGTGGLGGGFPFPGGGAGGLGGGFPFPGGGTGGLGGGFPFPGGGTGGLGGGFPFPGGGTGGLGGGFPFPGAGGAGGLGGGFPWPGGGTGGLGGGFPPIPCPPAGTLPFPIPGCP